MSVAELNQLVVAALRRAMRARGIEGNAAAFTRLLRAEAGDGPDPTTVSRWLRGEQIVPAWALVAASRASGMAPTDLLLPEADLVDLRRVVEDLRGQVAELRDTVAAAGEARPREDLDEVERLLAEVRRDVIEAGVALNRPVGMTEAEETEETTPTTRRDRLERQAGELQARVMDLRTLLGLPWDAPAYERGRSTGLQELAGHLVRQMGEAMERLRQQQAEAAERGR